MGQKEKTQGRWLLEAALAIFIVVMFTGAFYLGKITSKSIRNQTDTLLLYDTVWREVIKEKPVPKYVKIHDTIYIYDILIHEVPDIADTAEVLVDYSNTFIYSDTIDLEDLELSIEETVTNNRLTDRDIEYRITKPTIYNQMSGLFIGADASLNSLTPEISYIKNGFEYSLGYSFGSNFLSIGLKKQIWKPSSKKREKKSH
jgi:hypothetical protein